MAWLWASWQEYLDAVQPVSVNGPGLLVGARRNSWFETEHRLYDACREVTAAANSLRALGFTGSDNDRPPSNPSILDEAIRHVFDLVNAGEMLLLHHKRLAKSWAAYGFPHQHVLIEHLERYQATGRIYNEIHQLIKDTDELMDGYNEFIRSDEDFLVRDLDLPPELEADFRLARNLFSVGFEDIGLLIAGRGLEGVLRKIAQARKILLQAKGKPLPASEAVFHDLIEVMFQLRWKTKGTRLISSETKALLHYLRSLRNSGAHAAIHGSRDTVSPRETTTVIAQTANHLWKETAQTRARLTPTTIQKTW